MKANNLWNVYSCLSPQDWRIAFNKHGLRLINTYSDQQFKLVRTTPQNGINLESLRNRNAYPIPNTPKIILPKYQPDQTKIEAFVQSQKQCIVQAIQKMGCDLLILQKLKSVIKSIEMLVQKYGYFRIKAQMVKITRKQSLVIWLNEQEELQLRKYPILSENKQKAVEVMIDDLFAIFMLVDCHQGLRHAQIIMEDSKVKSFSESLAIIDRVIARKLLPSINRVRNKMQSPNQYLPEFLKRQNTPPNSGKCTTKLASPKHSFLKSIKRNRLSKIKSQKQFSSFKSMIGSSHRLKQIKSSSINKGKSCLTTIKSELKIPSDKFNGMPPFNNIKSNKQISPFRSIDQMLTKKQQQETNRQEPSSDKKLFRDSNKSLSTTHVHNSITSSGRTRLLDEDGFVQKRNATASFGPSQNSTNEAKPDNRFKIKISKIIEENNCEDGTQNSPQSQENSDMINRKSQYWLFQSDIQKDFYNLLYNDLSKQNNRSNMVMSEQLQQQINDILF